MHPLLDFIKHVPLYGRARRVAQLAGHPQPFVKRLKLKANGFRSRSQQRHNAGYFAVNIDAKTGFFAQLTWCLRVLVHAELYGLKPHIILSSEWYSRPGDSDWFDYFFENRVLAPEDKAQIERGAVKISCIEDIRELGLPDYLAHIDLPEAHRLFTKHFRVKPQIQDYVDAFVNKHFANKRVLAVHYRGTDKVESPRISLDACTQFIQSYLGNHPQLDCLFVASDEQSFVSHIKKQFTWIEVVVHDDQERSNDARAIHTTSERGDNYVKGKEALVNCLLLSRCSKLVRTTSALSAWSCVFNPRLEVILLNTPYDDSLWFPEREIVKKAGTLFASDFH